MKKKPVLVKEVIDKILLEYAPKKESLTSRIIEYWPKIVPEGAATVSRPVLIKNKVLLVSVSSSAWLHCLTIEKQNILSKLKKEVGDLNLNDLRFKIGDQNTEA